jgi:NagD protein
VKHREILSWLMDMDGVLVREEHAIPGADRFVARLRERETPFLVLTNNSIYTRRDLAARLAASGLHIPEDAIWTSALATASFLEAQRPGGSAFVIGESGLTTALHSARYTLTEREPSTGVEPYFVGKPNPLMMRSALNAIDAHSETTAMVGDRMDTDVVSGLEAGMHTVLVLTGSTTREEAERFPYRPSRIVDSIADLVDELG